MRRQKSPYVNGDLTQNKILPKKQDSAVQAWKRQDGPAFRLPLHATESTTRRSWLRGPGREARAAMLVTQLPEGRVRPELPDPVRGTPPDAPSPPPPPPSNHHAGSQMRRKHPPPHEGGLRGDVRGGHRPSGAWALAARSSRARASSASTSCRRGRGAIHTLVCPSNPFPPFPSPLLKIPRRGG